MVRYFTRISRRDSDFVWPKLKSEVFPRWLRRKTVNWSENSMTNPDPLWLGIANLVFKNEKTSAVITTLTRTLSFGGVCLDRSRGMDSLYTHLEDIVELFFARRRIRNRIDSHREKRRRSFYWCCFDVEAYLGSNKTFCKGGFAIVQV